MTRRLLRYAVLFAVVLLGACAPGGTQPGVVPSPESEGSIYDSIDPCSLVGDAMMASLALGAGLAQPDVPVGGARSCRWASTDHEYAVLFSFFPSDYTVDEIAPRYADSAWTEIDGRRAFTATSGLTALGPTCLVFTELAGGPVGYSQIRSLNESAKAADSSALCRRAIAFTRTVLAAANL